MNTAVRKTSACLVLTSNSLPLTDDDHWVVDTDYDNYAVHYSCREVAENGTCLNSYSFIFSRHLSGLRAEDQNIVQEKKTSLCLLGKYRRISHTGKLNTKSIWLCKVFCYVVFHQPVSLIRRDKDKSQSFTFAKTPWLQLLYSDLFPHKIFVFSRLIFYYFLPLSIAGFCNTTWSVYTRKRSIPLREHASFFCPWTLLCQAHLCSITLVSLSWNSRAPSRNK